MKTTLNKWLRESMDMVIELRDHRRREKKLNKNKLFKIAKRFFK